LASNAPTSRESEKGFTLLETLVALGIATILIASLIPISRNTVFRIATLSEQSASLAIMERATNGNGPFLRDSASSQDGVKLRVTKSPLPQFSYPRDERNQWQPVLYKIETRGPRGSVTQTEIIRLERVTP
jgi:prepilin-type N-terminal cleavage/methylation domain-containing protein